MKFIKACSAFFLLSFLFASCMDNAGDFDNSGSSGNNARALLYEEVANTVWFASDSRLDFLEYNKKLYLNYMPDGIKTTKWVQLTGNGTKVVSAKVIWSENIREIGQTSNVFIYIDEYNKVHFECDFFELTGMDKIEGVEPARFYKDNLPALKSDYLSNFAGEYTLNNGWKLQIGAKLSISKDVSHYWFANVLATEYDEKTKTYDLLLAHTSQKGAAGSTSPGITGNEPFVTKQGLFWNHCTLLLKFRGGYGMLSGLLVGLIAQMLPCHLIWTILILFLALRKPRFIMLTTSTLECREKILTAAGAVWKEESG